MKRDKRLLRNRGVILFVSIWGMKMKLSRYYYVCSRNKKLFMMMWKGFYLVVSVVFYVFLLVCIIKRKLYFWIKKVIYYEENKENRELRGLFINVWSYYVGGDKMFIFENKLICK